MEQPNKQPKNWFMYVRKSTDEEGYQAFFENTPAGKFFLSIVLSNAKYYIDNLSENVKRGNRQKLRRGEWPGQKSLGYVYDYKLRNIIPNPKTAQIVQKIFADYFVVLAAQQLLPSELKEMVDCIDIIDVRENLGPAKKNIFRKKN
jgi:hypothetical protein